MRHLTAAAVSAEGTFETAFVEHAYIEPEAGYAVPIGAGPDRIEIAACTQAPYMDREETARVLGIAPARVRIRPTACGGGFGGKLDVSVQPLLAVAAWVTKRPVRIVYSRTESMTSTTKRHPAHILRAPPADAEGRLTAFEMRADFDTGAYASWGPTVANRVPVHGMGPYRVANVAIATRAVYTNRAPAGAFRGFGVPQAAIAHETLAGRPGRAPGPRPLDHPPAQRAQSGRRHGLGPASSPIRRVCRNVSPPSKATGRRRWRALPPITRQGRAIGAASGIACHVVRLRQYLALQSLDHAHHARP